MMGKCKLLFSMVGKYETEYHRHIVFELKCRKKATENNILQLQFCNIVFFII